MRERVCLLVRSLCREKEKKKKKNAIGEVFAVKRLVGQSYLPKRVTCHNLSPPLSLSPLPLSLSPFIFACRHFGAVERARDVEAKRAFAPSQSYYSSAEQNKDSRFFVRGAASIDPVTKVKRNKNKKTESDRDETCQGWGEKKSAECFLLLFVLLSPKRTNNRKINRLIFFLSHSDQKCLLSFGSG